MIGVYVCTHICMCVQKCDLVRTNSVLTAMHFTGYLCLTSSENLSFLFECLPSLCSWISMLYPWICPVISTEWISKLWVALGCVLQGNWLILRFLLIQTMDFLQSKWNKNWLKQTIPLFNIIILRKNNRVVISIASSEEPGPAL